MISVKSSMASVGTNRGASKSRACVASARTMASALPPARATFSALTVRSRTRESSSASNTSDTLLAR